MRPHMRGLLRFSDFQYQNLGQTRLSSLKVHRIPVPLRLLSTGGILMLQSFCYWGLEQTSLRCTYAMGILRVLSPQQQYSQVSGRFREAKKKLGAPESSTSIPKTNVWKSCFISPKDPLNFSVQPFRLDGTAAFLLLTTSDVSGILSKWPRQMSTCPYLLVVVEVRQLLLPTLEERTPSRS